MSKKALNTQNLEALGAPKLAELVMEIAQGSAVIKRRLRLELTHALGAGELAREVRKRLATIRRSKSFVDWHKRKNLIADLDTQLEMITGKIAPEDPDLGFDLLWMFIALAPSVYERVDDSYGDVGDVFRYAITQLESIAPKIKHNPKSLAESTFEAICDNGYGQWDDLIPNIGTALSDTGFATLKALIDAYETAPLKPDPDVQGNIVSINGSGKSFGHDNSWRYDSKASQIQSWRQQIADQEGDVEAFIAQYSEEQKTNPNFAARIAERLLLSDKASEALDFLIASRDKGRSDYTPPAWNLAYVDTLSALGQTQELHDFRWQHFSETLSVDMLRDLLKALPDFEDFEVEERAKALALDHERFDRALNFCLEWPDYKLAAKLITDRHAELDGDAYYTLTPAADKLQPEHPLAAILCRRAMIRYTLDKAKSTRYKHAIRHFLECASVDNEIESYGSFLRHDEFERHLKSKHPRKEGFWRGVI